MHVVWVGLVTANQVSLHAASVDQMQQKLSPHQRPRNSMQPQARGQTHIWAAICLVLLPLQLCHTMNAQVYDADVIFKSDETC